MRRVLLLLLWRWLLPPSHCLLRAAEAAVGRRRRVPWRRRRLLRRQRPVTGRRVAGHGVVAAGNGRRSSGCHWTSPTPRPRDQPGGARPDWRLLRPAGRRRPRVCEAFDAHNLPSILAPHPALKASAPSSPDGGRGGGAASHGRGGCGPPRLPVRARGCGLAATRRETAAGRLFSVRPLRPRPRRRALAGQQARRRGGEAVKQAATGRRGPLSRFVATRCLSATRALCRRGRGRVSSSSLGVRPRPSPFSSRAPRRRRRRPTGQRLQGIVARLRASCVPPHSPGSRESPR